VAVGIVAWNFMSGCISEGADAFIIGGAILRQSALPLPLFIMRCYFRNLINLAHHSVIVVLVLLYVANFPGMGLLWSLLGIILVGMNLTWVMLLAAFLSTRFRDVPQIIAAVLQVAFFLSPVFWKVNEATANSPFVQFNPVYYAIEAIRGPLLSKSFPGDDYLMLFAAAVLGWIFSIGVYNQTRRRVVHYL
jgi:lipopolysaccharide transport system permease protein